MELVTKKIEFTRANMKSLLRENEQLRQNLEIVENKLAWMMEQVKLGQQRMYAAKNEGSSGLQLSFEALKDEEELGKGKEPLTEMITYTRQKKSVGRKIDTTGLPREIMVHELSAEEKCCKQCRKEMSEFGEDRSEQLEYIPAQIKVIEHVCKKYRCRECATVLSAKKPEGPIIKSLAGSSLITEVIIKKYEHHLPWYRQSKIFAQEGIEIPANTLGNWFMQAGEVLMPLKNAMKEELKQTHVLQVDETPVKVLEENKKGYLWAYHSGEANNRFIMFEYSGSRSGKVAEEELADYQGILQSDGYSGYNQLRDHQDITPLGCWAHCRRRFVEVVKLSRTPGVAHEILKYIAKLYEIEKQARIEQLDCKQREKLRKKRAPSILKKLENLIGNATAPPNSALGKAIGYASNQWKYLTKYIHHGEAEIDNNLVENQIRPFALGRRNWLFVGNEKAAKTAAMFYSLIQSCRINNVDPRQYLTYVLGQVHRMRRHEVEPRTLLPQFIDTTLFV